MSSYHRNNLYEHISDFLDYLRLIRNYSNNTIISYQTDLDQFAEFMYLTQYNEIAAESAEKYIDTGSVDLPILKSFISGLFEEK